MPEINSQSFESKSAQSKHSALEADIEKLSKEIAEKRNLLEHKNLSERELLKKTLEPMIGQQLQTANQQTSYIYQTNDDTQILPNYLKNSPIEIKLQVEKLIDLVFHQGLEKTIREAACIGPFILDAFHDALTDKLYEELKKRKLI